MKKAEEIVEKFSQNMVEEKVVEPKVIIPSAETLVDEIREKDLKEKKRLDALKVPTAYELLQRKLAKEKLQKGQ